MLSVCCCNNIHVKFGWQFRALSDQLYRTPDHHMFVRRRVVDQVIFLGTLDLVIVNLVNTLKC